MASDRVVSSSTRVSRAPSRRGRSTMIRRGDDGDARERTRTRTRCQCVRLASVSRGGFDDDRSKTKSKRARRRVGADPRVVARVEHHPRSIAHPRDRVHECPRFILVLFVFVLVVRERSHLHRRREHGRRRRRVVSNEIVAAAAASSLFSSLLQHHARVVRRQDVE